jgi:subtilisin family serine protease
MVFALLLAGGFAGLAVGDNAAPDVANDTATVSPALHDGDGTEIVLVYFGPDADDLTVSPSDRPNVTVETLKDRTSEAQAPLERHASQTPGVTLEQQFWLGNIAAVRIDHARADVDALAGIEGVEHVGPNFEVTVDDTVSKAPTLTQHLPSHPTPQLFNSLDGDVGVSSSSQATYGLNQINAPEVWSNYTKGDGTSVAVLDTGVDPDHPDIDVAKWSDWDSDGNRKGTSPQDYGSHGTHVSGTVSGGDASGTHIGVAPNTDLYHAAVLNQCSDRCGGNSLQIISAMQWAVDKNVDVISMSLGGSGQYYEGYIKPIRDAEAAGTIVIAASGNAGDGTSGSPGNVYDATSVGASKEDENIASYSSGKSITTANKWNDPPSDWPSEYIVPTISAPGSIVKSADSGGGYYYSSGTSMATPHVSGAVALLQAATSDTLTPDEIETALVETAFKPEGKDPGQDTRYGHGIIDVQAAIQYASNSEPNPANFEVSIDSTNSPVTEGDTLSVTATVQNTGDKTDTQIISLDIAGQRDSTSIQLAGGETQTVTLAWSNTDGAAGDYTATVTSSDDSASTGVSVESPSNFDVVIDSTTSPVTAGDVLQVTATVANTGDKTDTQTIALDIAGQRDTKSVTLDGQTSDTVTLAWSTGDGDAGDYTATVTSSDDSASTGVSVEQDTTPANFTVAIDSTTSPVTEGDDLSVTATVQNTGDETGTQTIALDVAGQRDSTSIQLAGGETQTVTLNWTTSDGDAGDYTASVTSENDSASTDVTVEDASTPANFAVSIDSTDSPVTEGDTLSVTATVQNTGDETGTQTIALDIAGQRDSTSVQLAGGETQTVTLNWTTSDGDAGDYTATVASENDSVSTSVTVQTKPDPASFNVSIDSTNSPVTESETLSVNATVENTGDETGTQELNLTVDGTVVDSTTLTVGGGNTTDTSLTWETESGDSGQYTATVTSENDSASAPVSVEAGADAEEFDVSLVETTSPVVEGETLDVEVTVENAGDQAATQSVTLTGGGAQRDTEVLTLDDGEQRTVTLHWETDVSDRGEHPVTVTTETDSVSTPVAIQQRSDFQVSLAETNAPVAEGDILSVDAAVSNLGNGTATQELSLLANGSTQSKTNVTLDADETGVVTLAWRTTGGDAGQQAISVASSDDSDSALVEITETVSLDVTVDETNAPVEAGNTLTVNATVENVGDEETTQVVTLTSGGDEHDETSVTLVPGETTTVTLAWETSADDAGERTVTVASAHGEATTSVTIESTGKTIDDYTNENGVVDIDGFVDGIDDFIAGDIGIDLFQTLLDSFISGEPVE